jgi:hypothetical protein
MANGWVAKLCLWSERGLSRIVGGRAVEPEARTSRGLRWFRLNRFRALNQVAGGQGGLRVGGILMTFVCVVSA